MKEPQRENRPAESAEALLGENGLRMRLLEDASGVDVALQGGEPADDGLGRRRFTVPSVTAEAGAAVERQLLLAESSRLRPRAWGRFVWVLLLSALCLGAFAGMYFFHVDKEEGWADAMKAVRAQLGDASARNERLSAAHEVAQKRLEDKTVEVERLDGLANKTLEQLTASLAETRTLRTEFEALKNEHNRLRATRVLELRNLLWSALRETGFGRKLERAASAFTKTTR